MRNFDVPALDYVWGCDGAVAARDAVGGGEVGVAVDADGNIYVEEE